jgi:hypothetical protein
MLDTAMRRELAAMVRDRAEDAFESEEERQFLVLAEDREELVSSAARAQHPVL